MAKKKEAAEAFVLDAAVEFGDVSIGDGTCRLGFVADRKAITLQQADRNLCGRRLVGKIVARATGTADQEGLPGLEDQDTTITGVFDVKRIGVTPKTVSAGLTFALASVDAESLTHFAKRSGRLRVSSTEDIPKDAAPVAAIEGGDE